MKSGSITNPYGRTKHIIEDMLRDWNKSDPDSSIVILQYFILSELMSLELLVKTQEVIPNNLMPFICQTAVGKINELSIF